MSSHSIRVVAAVIFSKHRNVLIGKRPESGSSPGKWEFPGGKVHEGESDEEAMRREIREELGITLDYMSRWMEFEHAYDGGPTVRLVFFVSRILNEQDPKPLAHSALAWVEPSRLDEYDFLKADLQVLAAIPGMARQFAE